MADVTIGGLTDRSPVAAGDLLEIQRPGDPDVSGKVEVDPLLTNAATVGAAIHGADAKTTPVDADTMPLIDSAASNVLKKVTWANIKATLKTYFDAIYQPLASALTSWAGVTRASGFDTWVGTPSMANLKTLLTDDPSGDFVGTTATQTLTNKDISNANNTYRAATTSAIGATELAVASEYRGNTAGNLSLTPAEVWTAAASVTLTDAAPVTISLSAMLTLADLSLANNRTLDFTNLKEGQHFIIQIVATGATRTVTMDSIADLWTGVEAGPYSITTSQRLFVCGFVPDGATRVEITHIGRR